MLDYREGQIWKDRRKQPRSVFVINCMYERLGGNDIHGITDTTHRLKGASLRLRGVMYGAGGPVEHDWDARSIAKAFPHLLFNPPQEPEDTEDK